MGITLDLPPDLEQELAAEAAKLNLSLSEYALRLLATRLTLAGKLPRTGAELIAYWQREGIVGSRPDIVDSQSYARHRFSKSELPPFRGERNFGCAERGLTSQLAIEFTIVNNLLAANRVYWCSSNKAPFGLTVSHLRVVWKGQLLPLAIGKMQHFLKRIARAPMSRQRLRTTNCQIPLGCGPAGDPTGGRSMRASDVAVLGQPTQRGAGLAIVPALKALV